jgi:phospholipid/cholesterol/gamma-HCH transport system substrate-binding protein
MATRAQKVRLSVFIIASSSVLLVFFLMLVGSRLLRRMDPYFIEYKNISVTGLEPGASVKYHGVQVGRVVAPSVKDAETIRVHIEVHSGTPIKEDTEAVLTLIGITGLKFIELLGGSMDAPDLPVGGTIEAGESAFEAITGRAEIILAKVEQVLNNLSSMTGPETTDRILATLDAVTTLTTDASGMLNENRGQIGRSLTQLDTLMVYLAHTGENLGNAVARIDAIVNSPEMSATVSNAAAVTERVRTELDSMNVAETMAGLRELMGNANKMVVNYDMMGMRARDDILGSLSNLEEALDNLREATEIVRDNPSVLLRGRQNTTDRIE